MKRPQEIRLPRILVATDGSSAWQSPVGVDVGPLLRDTSLDLLTRCADSLGSVTVDIDSVEGLSADDAGCEFLVSMLGIRSVITRRGAAAVKVAVLGGRAFYHVHSVDSTGFESSLEKHPRLPGIGTAISPGLVVLHLRDDQIERVPRPLVAWGFVHATGDARRCLERCDAIVVSAETAARLVGLGLSDRSRPESDRSPAGDVRKRRRPTPPDHPGSESPRPGKK